MDNPFDNIETAFLVLLNQQRQYSLWPEPLPIPAGWEIVFGPDSKDSCSCYIEREWVELKPGGWASDKPAQSDGQ